MRLWALRGLVSKRGTTPFPRRTDDTPGITPGRPVSGPLDAAVQCPTGALKANDGQVRADLNLCVHCMRCLRGEHPVEWRHDYAWSHTTDNQPTLPAAFAHSIKVRVVDAGDDGTCMAELMQLTAPQYSLHRLGIFFTPSPRHADVLLVIGPVTRAMRQPLIDTYEAMPTPKRVLAVGTDAINGGLFGPDFAVGRGVAEVIPVDQVIPGSPPPPLAIIEGLLAIMGRATAASDAEAKT